MVSVQELMQDQQKKMQKIFKNILTKYKKNNELTKLKEITSIHSSSFLKNNKHINKINKKIKNFIKKLLVNKKHIKYFYYDNLLNTITKMVYIVNLNNKDIYFIVRNKTIKLNQKFGYNLSSFYRMYLFFTYYYFIIKKTIFIHITRKNRNTFINIYNYLGSLITKNSTGIAVKSDNQKGKKKKLSYTSIIAANKAFTKFLEKAKKEAFYNIIYKKNNKYFNIKPTLLSLVKNKTKLSVNNIIIKANKPYGFGCKLKREKRKRTNRFSK